LNSTVVDRAALVALFKRATATDPFPISAGTKLLRGVLAKLQPPPPKLSGEPSEFFGEQAALNALGWNAGAIYRCQSSIWTRVFPRLNTSRSAASAMSMSEAADPGWPVRYAMPAATCNCQMAATPLRASILRAMASVAVCKRIMRETYRRKVKIVLRQKGCPGRRFTARTHPA